mmetsp:Transcript_34701/g.76329  ORF Transcript_34701/g.76329 Transcript_34701/m.76329 type:complete len:265 (-) Transcript_34701:50-844(-)
MSCARASAHATAQPCELLGSWQLVPATQRLCELSGCRPPFRLTLTTGRRLLLREHTLLIRSSFGVLLLLSQSIAPKGSLKLDRGADFGLVGPSLLGQALLRLELLADILSHLVRSWLAQRHGGDGVHLVNAPVAHDPLLIAPLTTREPRVAVAAEVLAHVRRDKEPRTDVVRAQLAFGAKLAQASAANVFAHAGLVEPTQRREAFRPIAMLKPVKAEGGAVAHKVWPDRGKVWSQIGVAFTQDLEQAVPRRKSRVHVRGGHHHE